MARIYATGFTRQKPVETLHEFFAVARSKNVADGLFDAGADRGRVMTVVQAVCDVVRPIHNPVAVLQILEGDFQREAIGGRKDGDVGDDRFAVFGFA